MKTLLNSLVALAAIAALTNCKAQAPDLTGTPRPAPAAIPKKPDARNFERNFYFARSESTVKQDKFDNNEISVLFRVQSNDGKSVDQLKKEDFKVLENNVAVNNFKVQADEKRSYQVVDIVFVVDITGSMGPFIEYAKVRLDEFIRKTHPKYHIRMCLSTFGDFVVQKCDRFYDNSSSQQVKEFRNALFNLSIKRGQGEYPGELDWEENPMRALTEATKAPWDQNSQRFVILVSDADFYSPEKPSKFFQQHQARPDTTAPSIAEVNQAIQTSQVKVFTITPPAEGYNSPIAGQPDITSSSQGEWFEFKRVIAKQITLDSIFGKILERINTTYRITYVVEQNQGLNATLPVEKRDIAVTTPKGSVKRESVTSSVPTGRPEYKQKWKLTDEAIRPDSARGWIDGKQLDKNEFSIQGGEVSLRQVPKAGASLKFDYFYEKIEKNFRMEPLVFNGNLTSANTKVWLNDKLARSEDIIFEQDIEGDTSVKLGPNVLGANDPYDIRRNESLKIRIQHQP
jgi:hypothetical protein